MKMTPKEEKKRLGEILKFAESGAKSLHLHRWTFEIVGIVAFCSMLAAYYAAKEGAIPLLVASIIIAVAALIDGAIFMWKLCSSNSALVAKYLDTEKIRARMSELGDA